LRRRGTLLRRVAGLRLAAGLVAPGDAGPGTANGEAAAGGVALHPVDFLVGGLEVVGLLVLVEPLEAVGIEVSVLGELVGALEFSLSSPPLRAPGERAIDARIGGAVVGFTAAERAQLR